MKSIYLIGSLTNTQIPVIGNKLRDAGFDVYDDWYSASEDADRWLHNYYKLRGFTHKQILNSYASKHIFELDKRHLDRCEIGILVFPAGRSGHLEFGYMVGQGKPGYILFDHEPEKYDQMHQFANAVFYNTHDMIDFLWANHE